MNLAKPYWNIRQHISLSNLSEDSLETFWFIPSSSSVTPLQSVTVPWETLQLPLLALKTLFGYSAPDLHLLVLKRLLGYSAPDLHLLVLKRLLGYSAPDIPLLVLKRLLGYSAPDILSWPSKDSSGILHQISTSWSSKDSWGILHQISLSWPSKDSWGILHQISLSWPSKDSWGILHQIFSPSPQKTLGVFCTRYPSPDPQKTLGVFCTRYPSPGRQKTLGVFCTRPPFPGPQKTWGILHQTSLSWSSKHSWGILHQISTSWLSKDSWGILHQTSLSWPSKTLETVCVISPSPVSVKTRETVCIRLPSSVIQKNPVLLRLTELTLVPQKTLDSLRQLLFSCPQDSPSCPSKHETLFTAGLALQSLKRLPFPSLKTWHTLHYWSSSPVTLKTPPPVPQNMTHSSLLVSLSSRSKDSPSCPSKYDTLFITGLSLQSLKRLPLLSLKTWDTLRYWFPSPVTLKTPPPVPQNMTHSSLLVSPSSHPKDSSITGPPLQSLKRPPLLSLKIWHTLHYWSLSPVTQKTPPPVPQNMRHSLLLVSLSSYSKDSPSCPSKYDTFFITGFPLKSPKRPPLLVSLSSHSKDPLLPLSLRTWDT